MNRLSAASVLAVIFGASLGVQPWIGALAQAPPAKPPAATSTPPRPPALPTPGRAPAAPKPPSAAPAGEIEPEAIQALRRMSAYLGTLNAFELTTDTTLDLVTEAGQRVQVGGRTHYKAKRPNGFQIDLVTDYMHRQFYYDGKQFTVVAPELHYYATAPAPPTIRETLDAIYNKYGIALPIEDLFRWNDPASNRAENVSSAFAVGPATVDGVPTDHYAFREGVHDWEIWIQKGDQPLPRKLVIVDRSDQARPAYVARLSWTLNPTLTTADFTFTPGPDAKQIHLAAVAK